MFRPRVIPVVLIDKEGQAVKSLKFNKRVYLGDPVNTVSLFNAFEVDELVLLNIDSRKKGFEIDFSILLEIAQEAKMPFSVGGGIRSLDDIRKILEIGAEKVVISSSFLSNTLFLKEAVEMFGSSSITICLDIKKSIFGNYHIWNNNSRYSDSIDSILDILEDYEVGELIVQSIDRDGTFTNYDFQLVSDIAKKVSFPVVALGGCSSIDDMKNITESSSVSAVAAGSMFVFQNKDRGVLINYPTKDELKVLNKSE